MNRIVCNTVDFVFRDEIDRMNPDEAPVLKDGKNWKKINLKANTPGGSTDSLYLLQEVLSEKVKPTYGYIDGMCSSCGYVALSYTDRIYAINKMVSVGGIGVYARMIVPNNENNFYQPFNFQKNEQKIKKPFARHFRLTRI